MLNVAGRPFLCGHRVIAGSRVFLTTFVRGLALALNSPRFACPLESPLSFISEKSLLKRVSEPKGTNPPLSYEWCLEHRQVCTIYLGDQMAPLQNSMIERPERVFEIEMVVFGTVDRLATIRTIKVLAQTAQGARRICRSRYGRCEIRGARVIKTKPAPACPDLFPG
ncbi:MAG: hypothetical protein V7642_2991 [Burkholderiales bacterium]|jgi:hypothetical protein